MTNLLSHPLQKERFLFARNLALKFVVGGVLWIIVSDLALFIFNSTNALQFSLLPFEFLKEISFVIVTGFIFFSILQRLPGHTEEVHQQEFFKKNSQPMLLYNRDSLRILDANEAAVLVYGYSRQEFLSMMIGDLQPKENNFYLLVDPIHNGSHSVLPGKLVCKDGTSVPAEIMAYPVVYQRQRVGLLQCKDVTRQVELEEQLKKARLQTEREISRKTAQLALLTKELQIRNREINKTNDELIALNHLMVDVNKRTASHLTQVMQKKAEQYKRFLNQVSDCAWSFDLTGRDENFVSQSSVKFFGLSEAEMIDRPNFWMQFIHADDIEMVAGILNTLETFGSAEFIYRIACGHADPAYIHQKAIVVYGETGVAVRLEYLITEADVFGMIYK